MCLSSFQTRDFVAVIELIRLISIIYVKYKYTNGISIRFWKCLHKIGLH